MWQRPVLAVTFVCGLLAPASARAQDLVRVAPVPPVIPSAQVPEDPTPAEAQGLLRLQLSSSDIGTQFYWRAPSGDTGPAFAWGRRTPLGSARNPSREFRELCAAPCTARVAPGAYELAVSVDSSQLASVPALTFSGHSQIDGELISRAPLRMVGMAAFAAGVLTAAILGLDTEQTCTVVQIGIDRHPDCKVVYPHVMRGVLWGGLVALLGVPLVLIPDAAEITATPAPR